MEAKELRIGNYVNLIADGHEHEPDTFKWSIDDYEYYETVMFNILPIPLTEEWLVKFGFEKIIHIHGYTFFLLKSTKKTRHVSISIYKTYTTVGATSCIHCAYVHQLQNLYFALTNEELIIKQ